MADKHTSIRETVLILGSAPDAEIPEADYAYCANASAYYYADRLQSIPSVKCIVGAHIAAAIPESGANEDLKALRDRVISVSYSEIIVLDHSPWYGEWNLSVAMKDLCKRTSAAATLLTANDRKELLKGLAGMREPIFSASLLEEAGNIRNAGRILNLLLFSYFKTAKETSPVLRPSTGLWSALVAMNNHGPDARYIMSGISLSEKAGRLAHPDGMVPGRIDGLTHHLHADRAVLDALKRNFLIQYNSPAGA